MYKDSKWITVKVHTMITEPKERSNFWKSKSRSANQGILRFLRNRKVHYRFHMRPLLDPILSQMNPVHFLTLLILSDSFQLYKCL